jgi:hypothetical protein
MNVVEKYQQNLRENDRMHWQIENLLKAKLYLESEKPNGDPHKFVKLLNWNVEPQDGYKYIKFRAIYLNTNNNEETEGDYTIEFIKIIPDIEYKPL